MAEISNVVLKDHSDLDVTYTPVSEEAGVYVLENNTDGRPAFAKRLTLATRRVPSTGTHVVTGKLVLPVVEPDANGNDQVVGSNIFDVKGRFSPRSTTNAREELRNSAVALFADGSLVAGLIDNAEGLF
jgi:hypothetical protein